MLCKMFPQAKESLRAVQSDEPAFTHCPRLPEAVFLPEGFLLPGGCAGVRSAMSGESPKPLPLARLAVYVLIFAFCGAVAVRELYYALSNNTTLATIRSVGRASVSARGTVFYFADYEYLDAQEILHAGRANDVPAVTRAGDHVKVQYFRYTPGSSRLAPSPVLCLSYGAIALLAAAVFAAEVRPSAGLIRRRTHSSILV